MRLIPGLLFAFLATTAPAWADITLTQKMTSKFVSGDTVTRIKGHKMRTDMTTPKGEQMTTIFDVDAGKMISLDAKKKEADVFDMSAGREAMAKIGAEGVKSSLTPTSETRQVAGHACTVHTASVSIAMELGKDMPPMTMTMTGPVCISKTAPGKADFAAFYLTAAEKGFFFQDARSVKAQPAQAKGMVSLYKSIVDAGVPLTMDMAIKFEGGGPMGAMMSKMGGMQITTETTQISESLVADDQFVTPAGFKVNEKK